MKSKHKNALEVPCGQRNVRLRKIYAQMADWGLTMPDDDPLMMHFGLNDFNRIGETEFWICNEVEAGYCGKYIFLFDGQRCPNHHHKIKHETFNVVKGMVVMTIDGNDTILAEGAVLSMPPETRHTFMATDGPALMIEVSQPCIIGDSYFVDPQIPIIPSD